MGHEAFSDKDMGESQVEDLPDHARDSEVKAGYYVSPMFLGSVCAIGLGLFSGTAGFALAAPILGTINADIGPDDNYVWIAIGYTVTLAIGYTVIGRLSDLCGRRYFGIGGAVMSLIGSIICATAQTIPAVIGGTVFLGLASAAQLTLPYFMAELVPMKHRFLTGFMYLWLTTPAVFGPAIAYAFVLNTAAGWRWCYYLLIITNGLGLVCWVLFYHPPTFVMVNPKSRWETVRDFDYIGFVLFVGGLTIFLIGLSWGGSVYPWNSAHVIATIVVGAVSLIAFVLFECYMPLKEPLVPMHLFKNWPWVAIVLVVSIAGSSFYGFSIVFPQMVFGIWTSDIRYGSLLACTSQAGFIAGLVLSAAANYLGNLRWQMVICAIISTALTGGVICITVDNMATIISLLVIGTTFLGYLDGVGLICTGIAADDQSELGAAVGAASTTRAIISAVATTIYSLVISNRIKVEIPAQVPPALVAAGLPQSSIEDFITAIPTGQFDDIPGATAGVIAAGVRAYQQAQVDTFRAVFYVTVALGAIMIVLTFFYPDLSSKMTSEVTATLRNKQERQEVINKFAREKDGQDVEHTQGEVARTQA